MNLLLSGNNTKGALESEVSFEEGSKILCEPGDGFCSARLLEQVISSARVDGFFADTFDTKNSPAFGAGEFALRVHPGMTYALAEAENVALGDHFDIPHISDPEGKRYTEVWVSYYPSIQAYPEVLASDSNTLVTSERVTIKPKIYPELIQSLPNPVGIGALLNFAYEGIKMVGGGSTVILYNTLAVVVYEWNGSGYTHTLIHGNKGFVVHASVEGIEVIVTYNEGGDDKIDFYSKSPSWSLYRTELWSYISRDVLLYGAYILVGGAVEDGLALLKSDLSVFYEADNPSYSETIPTLYSKYPAETRRVVGIDHVAISVLGGPFRQRLAYTEFDHNSAELKLYGGSSAEGYEPYLPEGEHHTFFTGYIILRHPYGIGADEGFLILTSHDEIFPYDYLDGEYSASQALTSYSSTNSYVMDEFLVNFNSQVFYASGPEELIPLYTFNFSVHKVFSGVFFPVKYPYYFLSEGDDIVKLVEVVKTHYDEVPDAEFTLKYTSEADIDEVTGFSVPAQASGAASLWLISKDNLSFYTWSGASWDPENDVANGCVLQSFIDGCNSGFPLGAGLTEVYVKVLMSSSERDSTPEFPYLETVMSMSTFGSPDVAFLCDDSHVSIEHLGDGVTRVTSKMSEEVVLSAQVCILAPPYNEDFDG